MSDDKTDSKTDDKPKTYFGLTPRDLIYAVVLVIGFGLIFSGLNGSLGLGLPEELMSAVGAAFGVGSAFALSWLRKR